MANVLDSNGLTVETRSEVLENLKADWQSIFGNDVNFDSNTSDGQLLEIFTQIVNDNNEVLTDIYNSFSPTNCGGTVQDQRYALNGIYRNAGSYTVQPIDITVDRTVTLQGIDSSSDDTVVGAYTVQSNDGQQWYLLDTTTIEYDSSKTTNKATLSFRASTKGNVLPTLNTITSQSTVVVGVTAVNNAVSPTSYGYEEETDDLFMTRREKVVANAGRNNATSIKGNILVLDGVNQCEIYEYIETRDDDNKLITDVNGVEPYTIWVIVDGGDGSDIANTIYNNNSNTMLKGDTIEYVTSLSGLNIPIRYDRPVAESLYIRFDIQKTKSSADFSEEIQQSIKEYVVENLHYNIGYYAETSLITETLRNAINTLVGYGVPINVEISNDNSTWVDYLKTSTVQHQFNITTENITINEVIE